MPIFKILNAEERRQFDSPPKFNGEDRKKYFRLNQKLESVLNGLRTPTTKVTFLLSYGYLKASGKLFQGFSDDDLDFVISALGFEKDQIDISKYTRFIARSHKKLILKHYEYSDLEINYEIKLREEIRFFLRSQTRQRQIFGSLADKMVKDGVLLPTYNYLASIIDEEVRNYDLTIETKLKASLTSEDIAEFEGLLTKSKSTKGGELDETLPENTPYILTEFKRFNQSFKPSKIKKNINALQKLKNLYNRFEPAKEAVNFTDEGIKYYAQLTINQKLYQIIRKGSDARLVYFYCFIKHQYYTINDTLGLNMPQLFAIKLKESVMKTILKTENSANNYLKKLKNQERSNISAFKL